MSLDHAILGFLNYGPLSGYDLKKVFDNSIRHFWSADQSHIYRVLTRLAENGYAKIECVQQETRPDRKVYHITNAGRLELVRWLNAPFEAEANRSAPLVKVFFSGQATDEQVIANFRSIVAQIKAVLEIYKQIPKIFESEFKPIYENMGTYSPREQFFWLSTLECGIANARSMMEWMESMIERLEKKDYTNRLD